MADLERYKQALINADKAGDEDAARQIAAKIREIQTQSVQAEVDPSAGGGELRPFGIDTGIQTPEWLDRGLAGAGKFMADTARGTEQFAREMVPGESEREQQLNQKIGQSKQRDAPLMDTTAGTVGNIAGGVATFLPTVMVPGANTYTGASLIGAGMGALQPITEGESRTSNAALGGAGGFMGRALAGGASRVLAPRTRPEVMALRGEGVTPTPGQIMGGAGQRIEEGMTSVPVVGDFIRSGQRRATEQFNKAALNRITAPLGRQVSKIGREGVEEAGKIVDEAYGKILPKLTAKVDDVFVNDLRAINEAAQELAEPQRKRFLEIVQNKVWNRLGDTPEVGGKVLKEVDSELGRLSRGFKGSQDLDIRDLGDAVAGLKQVLRDVVRRTSPRQYADDLARADQAYANLLRVENAAGRAGSKEGVFSPAALRGAVKQMDQSLRGRQYARGNALMQDLAESGESVLGATVPDSGTPFRGMNMLLMGGGYAIDPTIALGAGGASAMYTRPMQSIMAKALTSRPEISRAAGRGLQRLTPYSGPAGAAIAGQ